MFDGDNDSLNAQFIWNEYSNKGAVIYNTGLKIFLQIYSAKSTYLNCHHLVCVFLITPLCDCGHLTVHSTSTVAGFQCQRVNKPNLLNLCKNIFREFHSGFDMLSE